MLRSRLAQGVWGVLLVIVPVRAALAGPPAEQLKVVVNRVVATLEDPQLKGEARAEDRRRALRGATEMIFDWSEMGRRSLGLHWKKLDIAQQEEFTVLFRDLVERAYLGTIERYDGERIIYVAEVTDGDTAVVRTRVTTRQGTEIPVDYRMLRRPDRWVIYDVAVENVSLVANYRGQFNRIMQASSYQDLVAKMRSRLDALARVSTASSTGSQAARP